jgi:hypothetical protein
MTLLSTVATNSKESVISTRRPSLCPSKPPTTIKRSITYQHEQGNIETTDPVPSKLSLCAEFACVLVKWSATVRTTLGCSAAVSEAVALSVIVDQAKCTLTSFGVLMRIFNDQLFAAHQTVNVQRSKSLLPLLLRQTKPICHCAKSKTAKATQCGFDRTRCKQSQSRHGGCNSAISKKERCVWHVSLPADG